MKKNQHMIAVHSNGSGRDSGHLTYEIGDKDYFFNAPEYKCNIIVDDFANSKETELEDSLTYRKGIHFYTDKKMGEHELPELIVCYKESNYHDIKDICVDEGVVPSEKKDNTKFLSNYDAKSSLCKNWKDEVEFRFEDDAKSSSESESDVDPIEAGKENCNAPVIDDTAREELVSHSAFLVKEFHRQTSTLKALFETLSDAGSDVSQQPGQKPYIEVVPQKKTPARLLSYDSKVEGGNITFNFGCRKTAYSTGKSNDIVSERPLHLQNEFLSEEDKRCSQVHCHEGESSYSLPRTSSGLITYTGRIPFSGSISLGSDSSTTSTRSFAFPILQPEWCSSPVRMAKADRQNFRKHRGWRHGLLCCRGF